VMKGLKGFMENLGRRTGTAATWGLWAQASRALFVLVGLWLVVAAADLFLQAADSYWTWADYSPRLSRIDYWTVDPTDELFAFAVLVLVGAFAVSLLFGAISLLTARGRVEPTAGGGKRAGAGRIMSAAWPLYAALGMVWVGYMFLWKSMAVLERGVWSGAWHWWNSIEYVEHSGYFLASLVQVDIVVQLALAVLMIGLAWALPARVDRVFARDPRADRPGFWVTGLLYLFLGVSLIPAAYLAWSVAFSVSTVLRFTHGFGHEQKVLLLAGLLVVLFAWLASWRRNFMSLTGTAAAGRAVGARPARATLRAMLVHMAILVAATIACWVAVRGYWALKFHGLENSLRQKGYPTSVASLPVPAEGRESVRKELVEILGRFGRSANSTDYQVSAYRVIRLGRTLESWKVRAAAGTPGKVPVPPEASPGFDDSGWESMKVGNGAQYLLEGRIGWAWYRMTVNLTRKDLADGLTGLTFWGVDDNAVVYVNGSPVGEHQGWDQPFQLDGRKQLRPGANVIAVCVENTRGATGIWRPAQVMKRFDMKKFTSGGGGRTFADAIGDMYLGRILLRRWDEAPLRDARAVLRMTAAESLPRLVQVARKRSFFRVADYRKLAAAPFDVRMAVDTVEGWAAFETFNRSMVLKAAVDASDGKSGEAWEDVRAVVRMANLVGEDAPFWTKFTGRSGLRVAAEGAVTILLNNPAAVLPRDLARDFENATATEFFPEAVRASVAWTLDARRYEHHGWGRPNLAPQEGKNPPWLARLDWRYRYLTGVWDASVWSAVSFMQEFSSPIPGGEVGAKGTALLARVRRGDYFWEELSRTNGIFESWMSREYVNACKRDWGDKMWFPLPLVCSGINRYRAQTGRLPASLQDLTPRFVQGVHLKDVFTNRWLRYEARGSGYQILSDGSDGNGFSYWDNKNRSWRTKVLVQYPLPPAVKGDIRIMRE